MLRVEQQHPTWRKLYAEERKLLNLLTRRAAFPTGHLQKRVAGGVGYERGFLASILVYAKRFLAEAERFFADDPIQTVRFAKLSARQGSVAPAVLFRSPHLARLRALDLSNGGVGTDALCQIADSEHLAGLRSLVLTDNPVTAEGLSRVIESPKLPALSALDFNRSPVPGDAIADALAPCKAFRRVRSLDLFMTGVTLAGVRAIAESHDAAGLEVLRVGGPNFTYAERGVAPPDDEAVARTIAGSPHLTNLKELDLSHRPMGMGGLEALAGSPHLKNLHRLRLRYCGFPTHALKLVAESANFRGLYLLELGTRRHNYYDRGADPDEELVREALPDAAIRFE
jgi:hypothetical protein